MEKKFTQGIYLDVPVRTHAGFKFACFLEDRTMKEVLLSTIENFADAAESWDVIDAMLVNKAKKRELEKIEEETKREAEVH